MLFSSLVFLFYFLPLVLLVYYLSPRYGKNAVLLFFSLLFYAWGGINLTGLLIASVTINFFIAKQINRRIYAKKWLITGVIGNVLLLVIFKYTGFFVDNIGSLFHKDTHDWVHIALPIGISFYTFHQISMLRDIYQNPDLPKVHYSRTMLYVVFFPQLVAGPIVRYKDIIYQLKARSESLDQLALGIKRFIVGLFKKVIIANTLAGIADAIIDADHSTLSTGAVWLGILAYTLQIYFDFSGYSDMAIGLARMFGISLLENFEFPYISTSIKEFWRRWHISLSTWFRDYVYIPLGGNRVSPVRNYINLFLVFALTGFWHGASWSFLFWGIFHGVFLIIERLGFDKILSKTPIIIRWSYTMLIVMIGWVFFRIEDFDEAFKFVGRLFTTNHEATRVFYYFLDYERITVLLLGILLSLLPFNSWLKEIRPVSGIPTILLETGRNLLLLAALLYCVMELTSSSYNPFIYFNF
ncbi:MBOAT family protein [uncultured Fluviicola sp.]|uniref:MBOAT family O-acyltransferase n=1 Tax=uncultured Fluviicola sp. TaxID=463303 RepID=UPI0025F5E591|nr:MBOAT family protein [uncultured Fluviicola sp.]